MKLTVNSGGMLRYRYTAGGCTDFDFNTLAEVGEPYQPQFQEEIARRGLEVEYGKSLAFYPWVADFVTGKIEL